MKTSMEDAAHAIASALLPRIDAAVKINHIFSVGSVDLDGSVLYNTVKWDIEEAYEDAKDYFDTNKKEICRLVTQMLPKGWYVHDVTSHVIEGGLIMWLGYK